MWLILGTSTQPTDVVSVVSPITAILGVVALILGVINQMHAQRIKRELGTSRIGVDATKVSVESLIQSLERSDRDREEIEKEFRAHREYCTQRIRNLEREVERLHTMLIDRGEQIANLRKEIDPDE